MQGNPAFAGKSKI